jgi:hypothetical protein
VGEFATISATSHIVSPHILETSMVESFQFGPVCFFSAPPECYIHNNRLIEPATDIDRYLLLPSNCLFMEPNSFLAWLIRSVMSAVSLSSGTK